MHWTDASPSPPLAMHVGKAHPPPSGAPSFFPVTATAAEHFQEIASDEHGYASLRTDHRNIAISSDSGSIPTDQPYAGWLHVGVVSEEKNRIDILKVDLGMVGPASVRF